MTLTKAILLDLSPKAKNVEELLNALLTYMPKYGIDTKDRIAMFLAQAAHESGGFTALVENLNYSAKGLRATWPSRFPSDAIARQYERNPRKIASKVYADRLGNGSEASEEGWTYRGRGYFQSTGKSNYTALQKATGIQCVVNPDILTQIPEAVIAACYFWQSNKLNELADKKDIVACTKKINGGTIGLEDRKKHYEHLLELLK